MKNGRKDSHHGHFIIPESRGGTSEKCNVYHPWRGHHNPKHDAWHTLFGNLLPEEAISLIRLWTRKNEQWNMRYFRGKRGEPSKRFLALKILFGDLTPKEAIEWIDREFIRKEWLN